MQGDDPNVVTRSRYSIVSDDDGDDDDGSDATFDAEFCDCSDRYDTWRKLSSILILWNQR